METFHYEYTQPGLYWDGPSLHVTAIWFVFFVDVMKSLSKGWTYFWTLRYCYINPPINWLHTVKFIENLVIVLLENPRCFIQALKFITIFTSFIHPSLSRIRLIQPTPSQHSFLKSVLILSFLLCLDLPHCFFPFSISINIYAFLSLTCQP